MKKNLINIFLFLIFLLWIFNISKAGFVDFSELSKTSTWVASIATKSNLLEVKNGTLSQDVETYKSSFLAFVKTIASWLLVLYVVFSWAMMALSMWEKEDEIKKSKKSISFALIWIMLVNIPQAIFDSFEKSWTGSVTWSVGKTNLENLRINIFVNKDVFGWFIGWIIDFMQIIVLALAVLMILYNGAKLIISMWKNEVLTEAKNKIAYSVIALIFLWVMNYWKSVIFTWDVQWTWVSLVTTLANLALYFTAPVWIAFVSYAGFLYITANGSDDKVKKAKSIFVNAFIWVILLLGMYYFLSDLANLKF